MTAEVAGWTPVPLVLQTDLDHGGRWTSLRTAGTDAREWLWRNEDPATSAERLAVDPDAVAAGGGFVDAGGGEECFPQVRGVPDHGIAWALPWTAGDAGVHGAAVASVRTAYGTLTRRITDRDGTVRIDYEIQAERPFVHAAHLLLALSERAGLEFATVEPPMTVLDWPREGESSAGTWPTLPVTGGAGGDDLSRFGAADGTARCAIVTGVNRAFLVDGDQALDIAWGSTSPTAAMIWRNLKGFPEQAPYRSIGFEPMLGTGAGMDEAGAVPAGRHHWWIELTCRRP